MVVVKVGGGRAFRALFAKRLFLSDVFFVSFQEHNMMIDYRVSCRVLLPLGIP